MANKVKTGLSLIAALAAIVVLPLQVQAWAEDIAREQVLVAQGRQEVIDSRQNATEQYNFYTLRVEEAEEDLIFLETLMADGVQLTATQVRLYDKLKADLEEYERRQQEALEQLQNLEAYSETE